MQKLSGGFSLVLDLLSHLTFDLLSHLTFDLLAHLTFDLLAQNNLGRLADLVALDRRCPNSIA
jgi:hypothetical protein